MPKIPGYTTRPSTETVADLWSKPAAQLPDDLWPDDCLRTVTARPSGWLTIEELTSDADLSRGRGCILIPPEHSATVLEDTIWAGHNLGSVSVWADGGFGRGLIETENGADLEFFVQVRHPAGAEAPVIEISYPFLWYWDAYPTSNGWQYRDGAGRRAELIRYDHTGDRPRVQVRALEFRQYLAASGRSAVLQVDFTSHSDNGGFERIEDRFRNEWAHLQFVALAEGITARAAFSHVVGQYILTGLRGPRVPRFEDRNRDAEYPSFIYQADPETDEPLKHTCDPDQLGTYFDKDDTKLHYLTPIYFSREVLQPYAAEPNTYRIEATRLTCLNLWGVDISFNSVGLVEVYLGDIGRSIPSQEWANWLRHNVVPEGTMEEGRFRRDFLNQWASSRDIPGDLRRARQKAASVSEQLLGEPLWRPLAGDQGAEFESMIGPLNEDSTSLGKSLLMLPVAMIDAIDPGPLKTYLGGAEPGDKSLKLLQRFAEKLGDEDNSTAILRKLWDYRSQGGVAHLAGSSASKARRELGIEGMTNLEAFESIVQRITTFLGVITELMERKLEESEPEADRG